MSHRQPVLTSRTHCLAAGLIIAAGISGCSTSNHGPQHGQPDVTATVTLAPDGMPAVTPDSVSAREGDTIRWVFGTSGSPEFAVRFTSATGSPFEWSEQKGTAVSGTVRADAARGGRRTEYKYSVEVNGKVLDPKIIIEP